MKRNILLWLAGLLTVLLCVSMAWYLRELRPNLVAIGSIAAATATILNRPVPDPDRVSLWRPSIS
jgi:hypothetical protein